MTEGEKRDSTVPALLVEKLERLGVEISLPVAERCHQYLDLLHKQAKILNLTTIAEEDAQDLHLVDSLALLRIADVKEVSTLLDVGTGAGLPGIPLAIALPQTGVTLIESRQKKIGFLRKVCRELALENITVIHGRAEQLAFDPDLRERFDLATARALAPMEVLAEFLLPFVRTGGKAIAFKSDTTVAAGSLCESTLTKIGGAAGEVHSFSLPARGEKRSFIEILKQSSTPERYPRARHIISRKRS